MSHTGHHIPIRPSPKSFFRHLRTHTWFLTTRSTDIHDVVSTRAGGSPEPSSTPLLHHDPYFRSRFLVLTSLIRGLVKLYRALSLSLYGVICVSTYSPPSRLFFLSLFFVMTWMSFPPTFPIPQRMSFPPTFPVPQRVCALSCLLLCFGLLFQ